MEILRKPLTIEEIKAKVDEDNFVEGVVPMALSDIIDNDFEGFLDIISEKLVDSPLLMQVDYSVVGHQDEHTVLIKVSGDVSEVISFEEREE